MKLLRALVFTLSLVLLAAGYAASQVTYWQGTFEQYSKLVDVPVVSTLAAVVVACCIVFPFFGDRSEDPAK